MAALTAELYDIFPDGMTVSGDASNTCGGSASTGTDGASLYLDGGAIPVHGSCTITVDVTAAHAGSYCNKLWDGALQTTLGSNEVMTNAILTVVAAPIPS